MHNRLSILYSSTNVRKLQLLYVSLILPGFVTGNNKMVSIYRIGECYKHFAYLNRKLLCKYVYLGIFVFVAIETG